MSAEIVKARLFAQAGVDADRTQEQQDVDSAVEHWQEKTLDIYLSPPGRHIQPGSPSAVRIRQFNGESASVHQAPTERTQLLKLMAPRLF